MYENDQKHRVKETHGRFVSVMDHTKEETLHVSFTPTRNDNVCMETKYPLTYIYDGKTRSTSKGRYYIFPLNREVVLLSDSVETPRITVRVVKLDDPKDWPTPPPEDVGRAPSVDPPPPVAQEARDTSLPVDPPPVDPPPPVAQEGKKPKKRRREFYMCV